MNKVLIRTLMVGRLHPGLKKGSCFSALALFSNELL